VDEQRRKDLIRQYRDSPKAMGVYRVWCRETGREVLGASRDLRAALNRQQAQLSLGAHPDKALQDDWDRLGATGFVFEVLDTLKPGEDPDYDPADDLQQLLEMWRARLAAG
jgi:hypothetical protein